MSGSQASQLNKFHVKQGETQPSHTVGTGIEIQHSSKSIQTYAQSESQIPFRTQAHPHPQREAGSQNQPQAHGKEGRKPYSGRGEEVQDALTAG